VCKFQVHVIYEWSDKFRSAISVGQMCEVVRQFLLVHYLDVCCVFCVFVIFSFLFSSLFLFCTSFIYHGRRGRSLLSTIALLSVWTGSKPAVLEGLEVDQYMWGIVQSLSGAPSDEVTIDASANWKPVPPSTLASANDQPDLGLLQLTLTVR